MHKSIVLFIPSLRGGGVERSFINLSRGLAGKGFKVFLVTASSDRVHRVPDGVEYISFHRATTFKALHDLANFIRRTRPVMVISAMHHANIVAYTAIKLSGVKAVFVPTVHNRLHRPDESLKYRLSLVIAKALYRRTKTVAISAHIKREMVKNGYVRDPKDVVVIPNPVISNDIYRLSKEPIPLFSGINSETFTVLGVGRLVPAKNFPLLVRGFARALKLTNANLRLAILGEGPERGNLLTLIEQLEIFDNVVLPGFVRNPYSWMSNANVLVMTSIFEGYPLTVIEAAALELPIISTPYSPDVEELLSGYGAIVDYSEKSVANAIIRAVKGEVKAVPRERYEQFSIESVTEKYISNFLESCPS